MLGTSGLRRTALLAVVAGLTLACGRTDREASVQSTANIASTAAVQAFYDWYLPLASSSRGRAWDEAVRARPELFGDSLLAEFADDAAAALRYPGEIVGIDWDPFLNTQDPCERYEAGPPGGTKTRPEVPIHAICGGTRNTVPVIRVELAQVGERWVMRNFLHPDGGDLLASLRRLRVGRDAMRDSVPPA